MVTGSVLGWGWRGRVEAWPQGLAVVVFLGVAALFAWNPEVGAPEASGWVSLYP